MRPGDRKLAEKLANGLRDFERTKYPLPGIRSKTDRCVFLEQLVESIRRVRFVSAIAAREISELRADPASDLFDPVRAAILSKRRGRTDEAFWLVFLFVHFGKHPHAGWRYAREVYGRLGDGRRWDWARTSANPAAFRAWLDAHQTDLLRGDRRGFGNHRKYQSLDAHLATGTGAAVESYVRWVAPHGTHAALVQDALNQTAGDSRKAFDLLYRSMAQVASFGRTAKFDYLTMINKVGLAAIEPGSTYMQGATGPLSGARRLLQGSTATELSRAELDNRLVKLGAFLDVGMQVIEDALCNWQKSPSKFIAFRG